MSIRIISISIPDLNLQNCDQSQISIFYRIEGTQAQHQGPLTVPKSFKTKSIHSGSYLSILLYTGEFQIGYVELPLAEHFGDNFIGTLDNWFKVYGSDEVSSNGRNSQYNLQVGSIHLVVKLDQEQRQETGCARCKYLENLAMSQQNQLQHVDSTYGIVQDFKKWNTVLDNEGYHPNVQWQDVDLAALMQTTGPLDASEADYLKTIVRGMYGKLRSLSECDQELRRLREEVQSSYKARLDLQESIRETTDELNQEIKRHSELHSLANREKDEVSEELAMLQKQYRQIVTDNDTIKGQLMGREAECKQLQSKLQNEESWRKFCGDLQANLKETEGQREKLRGQYQQAINEFERHCKQRQDELQRALEQKDSVQKQLWEQNKRTDLIQRERDEQCQKAQQLRGELQEKQNKINQQSGQITQLENTVRNQERQLQENEQFYKQLESKFRESCRVNDQNNLEMQKLIAEYNKLQKVREQEYAELVSTKDKQYDLLEQINQLKSQVSRLESDLRLITQERDQLREDLRKLSKAFEELTVEREKFEAVLIQIRDRIDNLQRDNEGLRDEISKLTDNLKLQNQKNDKLQAENARLDDNVQKGQELLRKQDQDFKQAQNELQKAFKERQDLNNDFLDLQQAFGDLRAQSDTLEASLSQADDLAQQQQHQLSKYKDVDQQNSLLNDQLNQLRNSQRDLQNQLESNHKQFTMSLQDFNKKNEQWSKAQQDLEEEASQLEQALRNRDTELQELRRSDIDLRTEIANLEQHLCMQEDANEIFDGLRQECQQNAKDRDRAIEELEMISDIMVGQSERALATNKAISAMKDHLEERDAELDVLRGMVADLQRQKPVYTPKRDDPIDIALADYINTRGQTVQVPFTREDIGVYLFGTKRVFIKLENGKIIIRVGGGYMTIEEFVEVYTPLELDKLDNKKREDKHALRKAILGKYADSLINTDRPNSGDMSPTRASKLIKDALYSGNTGYATCYAVPKRIPSPKRPSSPSKVSSPRRSPSRAKKGKSFGDY